MSHNLDLQSLCLSCVDIARDAGAAILEVYNSDYSVEHKDDKTPLTDADLASHKLIVKRLEELTPDIPVLSEESAKLPFSERSSWNTYWLVDPLDGTKEFIKRNGEFTVNIALIHEHDSVIGVIHVPCLDTDYYGWQGGGSFKIENRGEAGNISVRKLDADSITIAGSRSHGSEAMQAYVKNLTDAFGEPELLSMGSSLKFCLVAEGKADLYPRLGLTSEWDTGAAQCIVEQAGGKVTLLDMAPLRYNTKDELLNPFFFVFGDDSQDWSSYLAD